MDSQDRHHLHEAVPPQYYETGIRTNIWQRFWHRGRLRLLQRAIRRLPRRPSQILDLGCHSGWLTSYLATWTGAAVTGLDFSESAIAYGRQHRPMLHLEVADITQPLAFPSSHFDLVTAFDVLEHLPGVPALLREVRRVLRPGGVFLITIPTGRLFGAVWWVWTRSRGAVWHDLHSRGFTDRVLRQELTTAGFTILHHERHFARTYHCISAQRGQDHG